MIRELEVPTRDVLKQRGLSWMERQSARARPHMVVTTLHPFQQAEETLYTIHCDRLMGGFGHFSSRPNMKFYRGFFDPFVRGIDNPTRSHFAAVHLHQHRYSMKIYLAAMHCHIKRPWRTKELHFGLYGQPPDPNVLFHVPGLIWKGKLCLKRPVFVFNDQGAEVGRLHEPKGFDYRYWKKNGGGDRWPDGCDQTLELYLQHVPENEKQMLMDALVVTAVALRGRSFIKWRNQRGPGTTGF